MGVEIAAAYVSLIPSFKGGRNAIANELSGPADAAADSVGRSSGNRFSKAWGAALIGGAAVGGAVLLGNALKNMAEQGMESIAVARTTEQIIEATGGAALVTSTQVGNLADALSRKTGIDDEAIQSASNLLLTFKNVQNAGEGQAAMFDRATAAALDLSKAGFGDAASAAKMLGKALNDPEKGISALSRAGVTFTEGQKEQIKALVESGKTLAAQKIIMKEVESQVGGVAEATKSPIEAFQTLYGNIQETIGGALLPALTEAFDTLSPVLEGIAEPLGLVAGTLGGVLSDALAAIAPILPPIADVFSRIAATAGTALARGLDALIPALLPLVEAFGSLLDALAPLLDLITPLVAAFSPLLELFAEGVAVIAPIVASIVEWVMQSDLLKGVLVGVTAGVIALNLAMSANPIGLVIVAIVALIGAIKWLWENNETFRTVVTVVWAAIQTAVKAVVDWFMEYVWPTVKWVIDALVTYFKAYFTVVKWVWDRIWDAVQVVVAWFMEYVWPVLKKVIDWIVEKFKLYKEAAILAWNAVKTAVMAVVDWFVDNVWPKIQTAVELIKIGFEGLKTRIEEIWNGITGFLSGMVGTFLEIGGNIVQGIKDGFMAPWNAFLGWVEEQVNKLPDVVKDVLGIASPSKVFEAIGSDTIEGWIVGAWSRGADAQAVAMTIGRAVIAAYAKGMRDEDPKVRAAARDTMLEAVQAAYEATVTQLRGNVDDIKAEMASFASSVSGSIMRVMDFGAAFSQVGTEGGVSFMDALRLQAEQAKLFAERVRQLIAAGMSQEALQQVLAQGATAGTAIADELLLGGAGRITEANDLVAAAQGAADKVGEFAADSFYGAGLKDAKATLSAFVDHFGKDGAGRERLMRLMDNLAASMDRTSTITVTVTTVFRSAFESGTLPGRDSGGPVSRGHAYIVGEHRAEVFVPDADGTIVPSISQHMASLTGSTDGRGRQVINLQVKLGDRDITELVDVRMDERDADSLQLVLAGAGV
ncbi:MAG: hypothetical protein Q7V58_09445 [Actinomycetota bacterium]|nr:hypothetical protein [Actinomycetota bacterium]